MFDNQPFWQLLNFKTLTIVTETCILLSISIHGDKSDLRKKNVDLLRILDLGRMKG